MLLLILFFYPDPVTSRAQRPDTLTLPECFRLANEKFPLMAGKPVLDQQVKLEDENLKSAFYPEMNLNAQAAYYSDVVTIAIDPPIPGVAFPHPYNAQYALTLDIRQMIYDGGTVKNRRVVKERATDIKQQDLEVKLYSFKQKLARVFFSALYLDDNYEILQQNMQQLRKATSEAEVALKKGVLLQGDVNILKAAQLDLRQQIIANRHDREAVIRILEMYLDTVFTPQIILTVPPPEIPATQALRPEMQLFSLQQSWLDASMQLQNVQRRPKLYGFGQVGYGRPGLNPLNENFKGFYLFGVKFTWNIWDWSNTGRQKKILSFERELVKNRENLFQQQMDADLIRINEEIGKLEEMISLDREKVGLRKEISGEYAGKLAGGVITPAEYERQLTAWQNAQIQLNLHQKQLLEKHIDYLVTKGNLNDYEKK